MLVHVKDNVQQLLMNNSLFGMAVGGPMQAILFKLYSLYPLSPASI
jgi:hypothetical protein